MGVPWPSSSNRLAIQLLCSSAAIALAFLQQPLLGSEAFGRPKELAFCAATWLALLCCAPTARREGRDLDIQLLIGTLLLSLASSLFARNGFAAFRALGHSLCTITLFGSARRLARSGSREHVLGAAALLVGLCAAGVVLEATSLLPRLSLPGRAPGGWIGNRNFAAHLLALGLPLLALQTQRATNSWASRGFAALSALDVIALTFTRCRSAWLATLIVCAACSLYYGIFRRSRRVLFHRPWLIAASLLTGPALSYFVPTPALSWSEPNAVLGTLPRLIEHDRGTGKGRLVQYRSTLSMIGEHPLLGVGPGNWSLAYPRYASAGDASLEPEALYPVQRLPNSDWLGFAAERGVPALAMLFAAFAVLGYRSLTALSHALRAGETDAARRALTLSCTLVIAAVVGSLDAVLARPEPAYFMALVAGALGGPLTESEQTNRIPAPFSRWQLAGLAFGSLIVAGTTARLLALVLATDGNAARREWSLRLDPGNVVLTGILAAKLARTGACTRAWQLVARAEQLSPYSCARQQVDMDCAGAPPLARNADR